MTALPAAQNFDCPNCGAQVELIDTNLSTLCVFCDTPIVKSVSSHQHSIEELVPFLITKIEASNAVKHYLQQAFFVKKELKTKSQPDHLKGVYLPFWVFQIQAKTKYSAKVGINYTETETYRDSKGNTRTRTVTKTDWHPLSGSHVGDYVDHLVCGSNVISETQSNHLEPFDLNKALQFDNSLLAGHIAEFPKFEKSDAVQVAHEEIHQLERQAIRSFLPGDSSTNIDSDTTIFTDLDTVYPILLPIWIASFHHQKETCHILVNGQTGKVIGTIPRDNVKIALIIIAMLLALALFIWLNQ